MPRIRTESDCEPDELRELLRPRDDAIVAEASSPQDRSAQNSAAFHCVDGPFVRYDRALSWSDVASTGRVRVVQEFDYRLAVPYWAPLFDLPLKRALRNGIRSGARPWWMTPDRLSPAQATTVAAMAMFNLVAGLIYGLLTQVLTFASADLGNGSAAEQSNVFAIVRLGVVVTILAMFLADRIGRRRIAIWAFAAAGVLTVAGAAAPTLWALTALQLVGRNLAIAGLICVDTITIEELPPGSRAMATGLGALAYGLGAGFIVMALPLADIAVWGWRLTFLVALITLPIVAHARRHLPESIRFQRLASSGESRRISRSRFVLVGSMFFLFNMFIAPASQLQNDYLRTERGFSALAITVLVVLTATPAGLGVLAGGRLADLRGRRAAIVPGLLAIGVFNVAFFTFSGAVMWVSTLFGSVLGALAVPALGVIAPELFPTAHRGGVRGVLTAIAVAGSVCGLLAAGQMVQANSYSSAFAVLSIAPFIAAALAFAVPETRGKKLEELNR